ncbi:MAG: NAD(P)-binding protein [Verrucomicrobiota bacterium]
MREVTIVGGGLAGLSLGIGLRKHDVAVTILEAGNYPRHRVCGEFICGLEPETQEALGIADLLADSQPCQLTGWYHREKFAWRRNLSSPALGISRYRLDQRLADRFTGLGGQLFENTRIKTDEDKPGMAWAAGRRQEQSEWLGLKFHCEGIEFDHDLELHLGDGAYMGISKIEDGRANVCGLFRKRPEINASKFDLPLAYMRASRLDNLVAKVDASGLDKSSIVGVSHLTYRWKPAPAERLSLGDQYMLIPPFTGNGMAMALQSAATALEPLVAYARGTSGWEETVATIRHGLQQRFRRRLAISRAIHPLIFHPGGQPVLSTVSRSGLLPFNFLFNLTH